MKKLIILILLLSPVFVFAQNKDIIFCKDGDTISCNIIKIESNTVYFSTLQSKTINKLNLLDIVKYSLGKKSIIDPDIIYNPAIKSDFAPLNNISKPNMDTIYYKKDNLRLPCTIDSIINNIIYCHRKYDANVFYATYNLQDIDKYVLGKNSIIEPNIKYNSEIKPVIKSLPVQSIIKDTGLQMQIQVQINDINKRIGRINGDNYEAGNYLKIAGRNSLIGLGLTVLSGALIFTGSYLMTQSLNSANWVGFSIAGGIIMTAGLGFYISVPIYIIKSGKVHTD